MDSYWMLTSILLTGICQMAGDIYLYLYLMNMNQTLWMSVVNDIDLLFCCVDRTQLDAQRRETDRLQQQLGGDNSSAQRNSGSMHSGLPSSPSKTGFSTLPSTELFSARRAHYDYSGPPLVLSVLSL
jgi:hypothetical protein